MLREIGEDLWVAEQPQRFFGVELGTRMTIARLGDGALWVCSPIAGLQRELDELGEVRSIVAPNRFHHLYVGDMAAAYPNARVYGSPGIARKRKDLRFDVQIREAGDADWGSIDAVRIGGMPILDELVFLHRPSQTLVVADLLMQLAPESALTTRWTMRAEGVHQRAGVPRSVRVLMLRDRSKMRTAVERVMSWSFDRIVLTHGPLVERDGHAVFERAMEWLIR